MCRRSFWANTGSTLGIVCIIFLSFRGLAPQFLPGLNSDHAVHILMTYDLQLPHDLYYWGQDRLGSLVPIIGHVLQKLLPLSPVEAVGLVNYGALIVAYLCFASFLTHALSRVLLAAAFFLPLRFYVDLLQSGQPYAAQFAGLGLATIGLRWLLFQWSRVTIWQRRLGMILTLGSMTISLWMSDFSIVYLGIVLGAIAHYLVLQLPAEQRQLRYPWMRLDTITLGGSIALGILFLRFAKASASHSGNYSKFNSPAELADLLGRMGNSFAKHLRFEGLSIWFSLAAYGSVAVTACVLYVIWRYRQSILKHSAQGTTIWLGSWGLAAGVSMTILLLSNWVYHPEEITQRYFVVVYVLCWLTVLRLTELIPQQARLMLVALLITLVVVSSMTLPPRLFALKSPRPMVVTLTKLKPLAPAGFIGEYWHAYILCSANPELFNCTPYDRRGKIGCPRGNGNPYKYRPRIGAVVRCKRCVEKVINSPTVYLVKQQWFEQFPQRIEQFGYCFVKSGEDVRIARHDMAPYRRLESGSELSF